MVFEKKRGTGRFYRKNGNVNRIVRVRNDKLNGVIWMLCDKHCINYQEAFELLISRLFEDFRPAAVVLDEMYDSCK